jgi:tetratricopeptide (TPR) repeat protein
MAIPADRPHSDRRDSPSDGPDSNPIAPNAVDSRPAVPAGEVYDWYVRGRELLARGDADAAVSVLSHTVAADPQSRSAREMLARAQFDARLYAEAANNFGQLVSRDPADHYAHFGLGLSARRLGSLDRAVEHLALAAAMRPDLSHYTQALRAARAARTTAAGGRSDQR